MASTLRTAIRTLAEAQPRNLRFDAPDPKTVEKVISALVILWKALKKAWPRFVKWFRAGLSDEEGERFEQLANRLPGVSSDELAELVTLARKDLRLDRQSVNETERDLPEAELDAAVDEA